MSSFCVVRAWLQGIIDAVGSFNLQAASFLGMDRIVGRSGQQQVEVRVVGKILQVRFTKGNEPSDSDLGWYTISNIDYASFAEIKTIEDLEGRQPIRWRFAAPFMTPQETYGLISALELMFESGELPSSVVKTVSIEQFRQAKSLTA